MARASRILLAIGLLPEGADFFVSANIYDQVPMPVPVLTKSRTVFARGLLRVPSYELIGPLLDQVRNELERVPWEAKEPRLFWRGGMRSFNACPCSAERADWPSRWLALNASRMLAQPEQLPPGQSKCHDMPQSLCRHVEALAMSAQQAGIRPACTCQRHITNRSTFEYCNRVRLCELSRQHPLLLDAKLAYIPEAYDEIREEAEERGYAAEYSKPSAQTHFRYLISTDGSTIDDTRIYWMLSSGSVVFKQITPLLPFGIPGLEPWKHFVPVREDFSDLVAKLRWARRNDAACRAIAERAEAFARLYFTEDQILHYVLRAIQAHLSLKA